MPYYAETGRSRPPDRLTDKFNIYFEGKIDTLSISGCCDDRLFQLSRLSLYLKILFTCNIELFVKTWFSIAEGKATP